MQYPVAAEPPESCVVCTDPRQYVGWQGQQWTTLDELAAAGHHTEISEEEPGLYGIGVDPAVGIGQRSLLVTSAAGNVLWDVPGFVDEAAYERVADAGGLVAVSASHPHFYGVIAEWADTFDVPAVLPEADLAWVVRRPRRLELYEDRVDLTPQITLVRCGGHFPGSAVLHWRGSADGAGVLLSGDSVTVVQDRRFVSFMWSYPNLIPLDARALDEIEAALGRLEFDRIYGGWWGRTVVREGKEVVARSLRRYRTAITETRSLEPDLDAFDRPSGDLF